MKRSLFIAVLLAAAPLGAQGFEEAAARGQLSFAQMLGGFKLAVFQKAAAPAAKPDAKALAQASADLSALFAQGAKVSAADLRGWWAGRRFLSLGVAPALLTGVDVPKDADQGPIGGTVFKTLLFPQIKLPEGLDAGALGPADFFDQIGSNAADNVAWAIHEDAKEWGETKFGETGAVTKRGDDAAEIRKNGAYLVAKFSDGSYAYFFKRVR